jgi:SAM-dependent methyltransferase
MELKALLRSRIKAARKRGASWVRLLDVVRLLATSERRSILWTRAMHRDSVHQSTTYTCEERYPEIFNLAATLAPDAERILSFGCSTGEELIALRRRFPEAQIVGAEINPRSRRIARRRLADDSRTQIVSSAHGTFDIIFALAVLQREPHKIAEMEIVDLSPHYGHERFDGAVRDLARMLKPGGLFCIANAHYRIEDSSVARQFEPIAASPLMEEPIFGPDGRRLERPTAQTVFRKAP